MTREHKIALIVGFSLILLVGVVLSDHLSSARQARIDEITDAESRVQVPEIPAWVRSDDVLASDGGGSARLVLNDPPPRAPDDGVGPKEPAGDGPLSAMAVGQRIADQVGEILAGDGPLLELVKIDMGGDVTLNGRRVGGGDAWHTVEKGDTLYQIARSFYGEGRHWRRILEANADKVTSDGTMHVGDRLRVPGAGPREIVPPESITAKPVDTVITPPAKAAPTGAGREYVVKKGDVLSKISQSELGTVKRMAEIIALNKDLIDDADDIREGMRLRLPAR